MVAEDNLTQHSVCLAPTEEWRLEGRNICFLLPTQGEGKYFSSEASHELHPGCVLVFNLSANAKVRASSRSGMVFRHFTVCLQDLISLFSNTEIILLQTVTDILCSARLVSATHDSARRSHELLAATPPQYSLEHSAHLLQIAVIFLSAEFQQVQNQRMGLVHAEDYLIKALQKLSADDIANLSVGELAKKFSCSRRHLNRVFHQYFNTSVAALKMEMRLLKALALLRDPQSKVIHVAEECGFNHLGLFNTCFKKRFHQSPGQWRKSIAEAEDEGGPRLSGSPSCHLNKQGLCPWSTKPDKKLSKETSASNCAQKAYTLTQSPDLCCVPTGSTLRSKYRL